MQDNRQVYAMQDTNGYIKIGVASNPSARVRDLQTGNAARISLLGSCAGGDNALGAEKHIHDCLRLIGYGASGEWFEPGIMTTIIANSIVTGGIEQASQLAMNMWCDYGEHSEDTLRRSVAMYQAKVDADVPDADAGLSWAKGRLDSYQHRHYI